MVVDGNVLYALRLIPIFESGDFFILRFDQLVHLFGFGVTTLLAYHLLKPSFGPNVNYRIVYPALILIGMGFGALNEIIEFVAVLLFPETGVGGYFNTLLDMVFNTLGAVLAVILIHIRRMAKER